MAESNLEETAAWVDSLGEKEIDALFRHVRTLEKDVYEALADWYSLMEKKGKQDSVLYYEDIRDLVVVMSAILLSVDTTGARVSMALDDIEDRARRGAQRHTRALARGRVLEGVNPFVTSVLRARQEAYVDSLVDDTRTQILGNITRSMSLRETPKQLIKRLAKASKRAGTGIKNAARGLLRRFYSAISRLIRTETMHAYNAHVSYIVDELARKDGKVKKQWVALLDMKTCMMCRGLHGQIVKPSDTFKSGFFAPPAHPHCRCFLTLVY